MTPILRFIGVGWTFLWRQPALVRSSVLLVFVPLTIMGYLDMPFEVERPEHAAVLVVLHIGTIVLLLWGTACTLTVGKRLLQAKAGRLRTSFNAVQGQARGLIVPLLLTDILRGCITLLWTLPLGALFIAFAVYADDRFSALSWAEAFERYPMTYLFIPAAILLAVPPIHYSLQTILSSFVVAYEKLAFRQALARSKQLTRGHLGRTIAIVAILVLLWIPGFIAAEILLVLFEERIALLAIPPATAFFDTFALVLWLLVFTQYYKALGGKTQATENEE